MLTRWLCTLTLPLLVAPAAAQIPTFELVETDPYSEEVAPFEPEEYREVKAAAVRMSAMPGQWVLLATQVFVPTHADVSAVENLSIKKTQWWTAQELEDLLAPTVGAVVNAVDSTAGLNPTSLPTNSNAELFIEPERLRDLIELGSANGYGGFATFAQPGDANSTQYWQTQPQTGWSTTTLKHWSLVSSPSPTSPGIPRMAMKALMELTLYQQIPNATQLIDSVDYAILIAEGMYLAMQAIVITPPTQNNPLLVDISPVMTTGNMTLTPDDPPWPMEDGEIINPILMVQAGTTIQLDATGGTAGMIADFSPVPEAGQVPEFLSPVPAYHVDFARISLTLPAPMPVGPVWIRLTNAMGGSTIATHVRIVAH